MTLAGRSRSGRDASRGTEFIDGSPDGIEQGGGIARAVAMFIEREDFGDGERLRGDEVFVIEKNEREPRPARRGLLLMQEMIEPFDGSAGEMAHGARAVEDEGEFGELRIHASSLAERDGQMLSHPPGNYSGGPFRRIRRKQSRRSTRS